MLDAFLILLVCQLVGEALDRSLGLGVPGPIIGLVLLIAALVLRSRLMKRADRPETRTETRTKPETGAEPGTKIEIPQNLSKVSHGLLSHLSILFVPACTGIVLHLERIASAWVPLALTIIVGTTLTFIATAGSFVLVSRWMKLDDPDAVIEPAPASGEKEGS
ncbi:MAG: CidA/LrgA family protein [Rhodospirillaceae bacterium]